MNLENQLLKIDEFKSRVEKLNKEKLVFDERNIFQKEFIAPLYEELKKVPHDVKKDFGKKINELKQKIEEIVNQRIEIIKQEALNSIKSEYDLTIPANYFESGSLNPIDLVKNRIINFFKKANFIIMTDSELTTDEYCFDRLNIKKDHPARGLSDTFFVDDHQLLRVHNTAITSKALEMFSHKDEIKVLSYGNVYRKDDDDATHSHQFNQIDMVWVKKGMSISNLKWLTKKLLQYIFETDDIKVRYRLSYFPFTEPSFEIDVSCFFCKQNGCHICKKTTWIEVLGAGLLHPNVLKDANIKQGLSGIAFGMGIDRIAMLKYQIDDIRRMYGNDFALLEEFKGRK